MGEIAKSITIEVPPDVVYNAIKTVDASRYTSDLFKGETSVTLTKDIPNSLLYYKSSSWGTKVETEIAFRPVGESHCEVTIKLKYRLAKEESMKQWFIQAIDSLLMLEYGYKTGIQRRPK